MKLIFYCFFLNFKSVYCFSFQNFFFHFFFSSNKFQKTKELNVDVSEREIDDLMYQLDADGDGIVKFEEWKNGSEF